MQLGILCFLLILAMCVHRLRSKCLVEKVKGTEKEEENILSNEAGKLFVPQNRDPDQINPMVVPAEVGEVFVFGIYCDASWC